MSFFDDGDDPPPTTAQRVPRSPRPRRPSVAGGMGAPDHQTLMVRRAVALVGGLVLLILIVVGISGCLKSQRRSALQSYNRNVGSIGTEAVQQVAQPLFKALSGAGSKNALDVELQIDQLKMTAQTEASRVRGLSVPSEMAGAQRALETSADFRASAVGKLAEQIRNALGTTGASNAEGQIAGQMEVLLASDVLYSQRVAPLVQQALNDNGIHDQPTGPSRFIDDLAWLDPTTVAARITGGGGSAAPAGAVTPGPHGHSLSAVSVGANALAPAPAVNRISGGSNPTFSVQLANGGASAESNVKVDVTVEAGGKKVTATKTIDKTQPGQTASVDIPVTGVPLSTAARVTVNIEPVPGEKNLANNKGTFTAVFGP